MPVLKLSLWLRPQSYYGLLVTLGILVISQPVAQQLRGGPWITELVLALVLTSALSEVADNRRGMWVAVLLGCPAIAGRVLSAAWEKPPTALVVVIFAFTIAFLIAILVAIMRHILSTEQVSGDTLRGAICVYLLLGMTWAIAYRFLFVLDPGAFSFADHLIAQQEGRSGIATLTYFSFVTLTTLGYGDISPITPVARNLAWSEAMVGQLFVAITIARLVGLRIARRNEPPVE